MPKKTSNTSTSNPKPKEDLQIYFIISYVLLLITGIIVLLVKGEEDKRLKMHSIQAILLGIVFIAIWIIFGWVAFGIIADVLNFLLWLYALYVGFEAAAGTDIEIPVITKYAKRYANISK
ncbi:MAG: hypothetical protein ABR981_02310 [Candidatus Micrarchaeaceae archaeon]|jgi:uncharacterized membrane protein